MQRFHSKSIDIMAKQQGIHQIKGKVGSMSYYRQSGVTDGLIRSINQGLSARVKSDDAYANTRLNNCEFKRAAAIVKALYSSIQPAWRTMFRRFAFADIVKTYLASIKEDAHNWGSRIPAADLAELTIDAFENHAKSGAYDGMYGDITGTVDAQNLVVGINISAAKQSELQALGIDGVYIKPVAVAVGCKIMTDPKLTGVISVRSKEDFLENCPFTGTAITTSVDVEVLGSNFINAAWAILFDGMDSDAVTVFVGIMPYRKVLNTEYILQERCTYVTLAAHVDDFSA